MVIPDENYADVCDPRPINASIILVWNWLIAWLENKTLATLQGQSKLAGTVLF